MRRRQVDALFAAADRLAEIAPDPVSLADVEAEIQAARKQRRANAGFR